MGSARPAQSEAPTPGSKLLPRLPAIGFISRRPSTVVPLMDVVRTGVAAAAARGSLESGMKAPTRQRSGDQLGKIEGLRASVAPASQGEERVGRTARPGDPCPLGGSSRAGPQRGPRTSPLPAAPGQLGLGARTPRGCARPAQCLSESLRLTDMQRHCFTFWIFLSRKGGSSPGHSSSTRTEATRWGLQKAQDWKDSSSFFTCRGM